MAGPHLSHAIAFRNRNSTRRDRGPLARRRSRVGIWFVLPAVALSVLFSVVPTVATGGMSLFKWSLLGKATWVGLDNYRKLLTDKALIDSFGFTALYTVIITIALLVVGLMLASLVRPPGRASALLRTVAVIPVVIGFATASYVMLWLLDTRIGLINQALIDLGLIAEPVSWLGEPSTAIASVVIFVVWKTVGLTMLLILGGMHAIPEDVYEAAAIDGAGRWRQFRAITLPLLQPTISFVTVLTVISSVLAFDQFFILTRGGPDGATTTVVFAIYRAAFIDFNLGYASAQSIALLVVLVALTAIQLWLSRAREDR